MAPRGVLLLVILCTAVVAFDVQHELRKNSRPIQKWISQKNPNWYQDHFGNSSTPLDQWIVKVKPGTNIHDLAESMDMKVVNHLSKFGNIYTLEPNESLKKSKRSELPRYVMTSLQSVDSVHWAEQDHLRTYEKRQTVRDPSFTRQWHLKNNQLTGADANVVAAWALGVNGEGVQVCIVDDGLEHGHPDIRPNYVPDDSFDFNDNDANPDPTTASAADNHGTACAGVAAARDDGTSCGVGAAFRAKVSGIRAIAGPISGQGIADSITYHPQNNDIYSCSWGIPDCVARNGAPPVCRLVPQSNIQQEALNKNVKEGRGGKGAIYVFAAGNSRQEQSDTNYQDFPRSIQVINVAASTNQDVFSYYSCPGAGLTVSAPSNGGTLGITTSDRAAAANLGYTANSDCTNNFGGTSSATPLVAGIIALMLQKNPNLTWRDVQDIIAHTARKIDDQDPGWQTNGGGLHVSHDYGFGSIDAEAAVKASDERTTYLTCDKSSTSDTKTVNQQIPDNNQNGIESKLTVSSGGDIELIEHTIVTVDITHPARGDLDIILISPKGTTSILARQRNDAAPNYQNWQFRTNFNWDESPKGEWTLRVIDSANADIGTLNSWSLQFHGKCPGEVSAKISQGAIAGIVIGVVAGVAILGVVGFLAFKKYRASQML